MNVAWGNPDPTGDVEGPTVTEQSIPEFYTYVVADDAATLANEALRDINTGDPDRSHLPDQEALVAAANAWRALGNGSPSWVWSDNEDFAVLLGHYFGCPVGRPDTSEEGH